jgi:hypothetical protein
LTLDVPAAAPPAAGLEGYLACLRRWTAADLARAGRLDDAAQVVAPGGGLPADPLSCDLLGRIRAQQGRYEDAARAWMRALDLDPASAATKKALARVERRQPGVLAAVRAAPPKAPTGGTGGGGSPRATAPRGVVEATVLTTPAGAILAFDGPGAALLGLAEPDSLGADVRALFAPSTRRVDERNVADLRGGQTVEPCDCRCLGANGRELRGTYDVDGIVDPRGRWVAVRRKFALRVPPPPAPRS